MQSVFLGRPVHWLMLAGIAAVLWVAGNYHLHVVHFNLFVIVVLLLAVGAIALVVLRYRPGDRIMRDPLE